MSILEEFGVEDYREIISDLDYWSIPEMSDGDVPFARNDSSIIDNSDNRISQEIVEETVLENSEEQSVEIFEEQVIENDASYKNFDFDDDIDWDDGSFDSDINLTEGSANNDYELQSGESSSGRIGIQFFANPKTTVDSSVSISETVSDIVAELEIYTAASKEGHGSIVKISSETKDNIAKLDSKQLLEVIKNTDVRYGMRTVMNSANSEQLNIVVNELISNSDTLISNPNFVRALSGNIDFNIYTSLVDSILSNSSAGNRLISTLSDAGIFELFNKYSENSNMLKRLFNNMSASQYRTIYIEYFDDQLSGTTISDLLESYISKELSNKQL